MNGRAAHNWIEVGGCALGFAAGGPLAGVILGLIAYAYNRWEDRQWREVEHHGRGDSTSGTPSSTTAETGSSQQSTMTGQSVS